MFSKLWGPLVEVVGRKDALCSALPIELTGPAVRVFISGAGSFLRTLSVCPQILWASVHILAIYKRVCRMAWEEKNDRSLEI